MMAQPCPHCRKWQLYQERSDVVCLTCGYRAPVSGRAFDRDTAEERTGYPYCARLDLEDDSFMSQPFRIGENGR